MSDCADPKPIRTAARAAAIACAALLLVSLASCAPQSGVPAAPQSSAAAPDVSAPDETCSPNEASDATSFAVTNNTDADVAVSWYSYDCAAEPYATLKPGESVTLETFVGHRWVATAGSEAVSEFTAEAGSGTWSVD